MKDTIEHITDETTTTTTDWMKVARAGAMTMVVWSIALNVLAGGIPPVMVIGVVFFGFVPFLRGERPRLGLAFAVLSVMILAANLPIVLDDLSNPESAPAFILNLLSIVGVSVAAIGGFAAFRRSGTASISRIAWVAPSVFVAGAVLSLVLAAQTSSDPALPGDVEMVALGAQWQASDLEIARGNGLWIDNQDGIRHTFAIESEGFEFEIPALKSVRADVDVPPGTYQFACTVPGHESMVGTVTVTG
jgi:plastocyanin